MAHSIITETIAGTLDLSKQVPAADLDPVIAGKEQTDPKMMDTKLRPVHFVTPDNMGKDLKGSKRFNFPEETKNE